MSNDIKIKLDKIGPGFCLEKWTSAVFHLQKGSTNSCHHCRSHVIPLEEVKKNIHAIHNTPQKKIQRKMMMDGGWSDECDYCSAVEKQGGTSDRIIVSGRERSSKYYDSIVNNWSQDFKPTNIDVSFNNVCNLACSYCGPHNSTTWVKDIEENGRYPGNYNNIPVDLQLVVSENPYLEPFWEWFKDVHPSLENLIINGGEPLMIKETYRCLEYIFNNPNKNLDVTINSNLCVEDKLIDRLIEIVSKIKKGEHVKSLSIFTSNEAHGKQAEYIRHGLDYEKWRENIERLLSVEDIGIGINATYNVLSVHSFDKLSEDIKNFANRYGEYRLMYMPKYLRNPEFLNIRLLPKEYRYKIVDSLDYIKNNFNNQQTQTRFEQILNYYDSGFMTDTTQLKMFVEEYNRRRNLNFKEVFSEYDWLFK
jgi:MoaA/NifB/PqqE/SkfB family radical SAM enzyme